MKFISKIPLFPKFMFIYLFFLLFAALAGAQEFNMNSMPPPKAAIQYELGTLKKGTKVFVDITIPENWHVNANIVNDEFLKPSSIEIDAKGIKFAQPIWPEPLKEYNEVLELENLVYRGNFQIAIPIDSIAAEYDSLTTNAIFSYQACDNSICLAPSKIEIRLDSKNGSPLQNDGIKKNNEASKSTLVLLAFALLGGLILNLMPCVLPVLSLKLFSLIKQAGESRQRLVQLGICTTLGILVCFWTLATIVSIIKFTGGNAGWGMQFQNAGFIAFMAIILTAFSMSFFGIFEIWLPGSATTKMDAAGQKKGLIGAFFTGALLVLLSTPCSAPFLGTAMGFAFSADIPTLFLFFTAAGIGLAIPYLLVSLFPAALKIFPKPGPWMVKLQKIMGILLLATVGWLLWIVREQAGITGVALFAIIVILSIGASFCIGKFAPPGVPFSREVISLAMTILIMAILWFTLIAPKYETEADAIFNARINQEKTDDGWLRYSPELVEHMAQSGKTMFIDVTADWCITCKTNESLILNQKDFRQAMDSLGVVLIKADWTRKTPEVNALLASMEKSGVPAYTIYPKGDARQQIVLAELLTISNIVEKITNNQ